MVINALLLALLIGVGMFSRIARRKLTLAGAMMGAALALCVYAGAGFTGMAMMTVFFLLGSAATSWRLEWKRQQGLAESEKGTRTAMQVVANAGVPAILGLVGFFYPDALWPVMMAGAFAAAAADTLSSELGNIYGRRYYTIWGFRRDQRGLNGVISLEGTLFGLAGSVLIALIFAVGFRGNACDVLLVVLAGTIGNLTDSVLGATLERRGWIGNNGVNFLNTAVGAGMVWVGGWFG